MKKLIIVFLGGGLGSALRYLLSKLITFKTNGFPWSTFCANLLGCFLIGILSGYLLRTQSENQTGFLLFATVGFCGGFTTFSTFSNENLGFLRSGDFLMFFIYSFSSLILGVVMVYLGIALDKYTH